jgi:hypothetical protein
MTNAIAISATHMSCCQHHAGTCATFHAVHVKCSCLMKKPGDDNVAANTSCHGLLHLVAGAVAAPSTAAPAAAPANASAAPSNATLAATAAPAAACSLSPRVAGGMLQHNGRDIFLTGVNLGNVQLLPFEGNPYGLPAAELRSMVDSALAEIAATGANSVRFWLHIDGSRSPSWGIDQVSMPGVLDGSLLLPGIQDTCQLNPRTNVSFTWNKH